MKKLLEFILQNIVGPDISFEISEIEDENGITFEVTLPEEVSGKVIGRNGKNIKAIRDIVSILARREHKRVFIRVKN